MEDKRADWASRNFALADFSFTGVGGFHPGLVRSGPHPDRIRTDEKPNSQIV
jgi:hypothetical protein